MSEHERRVHAKDILAYENKDPLGGGSYLPGMSANDQ
jgi:hypothetical protein